MLQPHELLGRSLRHWAAVRPVCDVLCAFEYLHENKTLLFSALTRQLADTPNAQVPPPLSLTLWHCILTSTIREGEAHEKNIEELRVFVMGTIISECIVGSQQSALALTTIEFLRSLFQLLPKGSPHYYEVSLVLPPQPCPLFIYLFI